MLPDRRHAPRFVAAITLAMGVMGVAAAQPDGGETLRMVGTLPATARVVIAADSLGAEGARAAVRGVAAFLSDAGALGRSRDAWTSLGVAVGAEPGAAFGELLGTRAVLVIGDGGGREDPYAVLSELAPEVERRLRGALRPAPRGLAGGGPVLSLEGGAFELATRRGPVGARFLLAPRGARRFFDELLPVLDGGTAVTTLSMTTPWAHVRALGPSDVLLLVRDPATPTPADDDLDRAGAMLTEDEPFFALAADATPRGWRGRFTASERMLRLRVPAGAPSRTTAAPWPAGAAGVLEPGAALFVGGRPGDQPVPVAALDGLLGVRPLLASMLAALGLRAHPETFALIAAYETPAGLELLAAIETGVSGAVVADAADDATARAPNAISVTTPAAGTTPERRWTILSLDPAGSGGGVPSVRARALAAALETAPTGTDATSFRLLVRPAILSRRWSQPPPPALLASADESGAPTPPPSPDPSRAFRWIDRVESRIQRSDDGLVRGTVVVEFAHPATGGS